MAKTQLTVVERLLLINQYEMRNRIEKTKDYDNFIEILRSGYESRYHQITDQVFDPMQEALGDRVGDVLQMYRVLDDYYRAHPEDALASDHMAKFAGFDGNNESSETAYVRFMVDKCDEWSEQKARAKETDHFNSHTEMWPRYERMLEVWERLGEPYPLTAEQAKEIVGAATLKG